jgi:hypothetical protein
MHSPTSTTTISQTAQNTLPLAPPPYSDPEPVAGKNQSACCHCPLPARLKQLKRSVHRLLPCGSGWAEGGGQGPRVGAPLEYNGPNPKIASEPMGVGALQSNHRFQLRAADIKSVFCRFLMVFGPHRPPLPPHALQGPPWGPPRAPAPPCPRGRPPAAPALPSPPVIPPTHTLLPSHAPGQRSISARAELDGLRPMRFTQILLTSRCCSRHGLLEHFTDSSSMAHT